MKEKTLGRAILLSLVALALACDNNPSEPKSEVTLTPTDPVVRVGMSLQLEARAAEGATTTPSVSGWSSSAPSIIEVDGVGLITAKTAGSATITATTSAGLAEVLVTAELPDVGLQTKDRTICGVSTAGEGYCWGVNSLGQAGIGNTQSIVAAPAKVAGGLSFSNVTAGGAHSCAITATGTYCWGCNAEGERGDGTSAYSIGKSGTCGDVVPTPVKVLGTQTFADIDAAGSVLVSEQGGVCSDAVCQAATCAINGSGQLYCWGRLVTTPLALSTALTFRSLSSAMTYSCGVTADFAVSCFNHVWNSQGTIAIAPVPGAVNMQAVSAGRFHACAIDKQGRAFCWGANVRGQLGSPSNETCQARFFGSYICRASADSVYGGLRFRSISASGGTPGNGLEPISHTCGVTVNQDVYCWGSNANGQLGNGGQNDSAIPVRVTADLKFRSVAAGYGFTCALAANGAAYCWGGLPTVAYLPESNPKVVTPTAIGTSIAFK